MAIEELSKNNPDGSRAKGLHLPVTASSSATVVLTPAQSGGVFLLDRATVSYELPTPAAGMVFKFMSTIAGTAGSQQVNTGSASVFFLGSIQFAVEAAATGEAHLADGATDIGIDLTSAETGALIGSSFTVTALSSTIWNVTGLCNASGTMTTPFTT